MGKLTGTPRVEQHVDGSIDLMLLDSSHRLAGRVYEYFPHGNGRVRRYLHLWNKHVETSIEFPIF